MDCPTEQTLIQNKLGKLAGVQRLEFNLINRVLGVTCETVAEAIESLGGPSRCRRRRSAHPGAREKTLVAAGVVRCRRARR